MGSDNSAHFFFFFFVSGQLGDVKLEDLPGPEALLRPGTKYSVQYSSNLETKKKIYSADLNTNERSNTLSNKRLVKPFKW